MTVAQEILRQLGGNRFGTMTGAKVLYGTDNSLVMSLPATMVKGKASRLIVRLDPSDTYTVTTAKIRKLELIEVDSRSGVYCDQLGDVFTSMTGLDTHL